MKDYIMFSFVFVCLYLTALGSNDETFSAATSLEELHSNATVLKDFINNVTKLEKQQSDVPTYAEESSNNATDLNISHEETAAQLNKNETEPTLQHGIKSKIKGGYNKVKNKIRDIGTKVKNKIKDIGSNIGTGGSGGSSYRYRYRRPTSSYSSGSYPEMVWVAFGVIGGCILIAVIYYMVRASYKSENDEPEIVGSKTIN